MRAETAYVGEADVRDAIEKASKFARKTVRVFNHIIVLDDKTKF